MATDQEVEQLRRMTGEVDSGTYDDDELAALIDSVGMNGAAKSVWCEKAGSLAGMVDITEAGSSRSNSDLFKNAQAMCTYYTGIVDDEATTEGGEPGIDWSTTRAIVRS